MRVQDDLGIDEVSGGDSFVQNLAKSNSSRHICRLMGEHASLSVVFIHYRTPPTEEKVDYIRYLGPRCLRVC